MYIYKSVAGLRHVSHCDNFKVVSTLVANNQAKSVTFLHMQVSEPSLAQSKGPCIILQKNDANILKWGSAKFAEI